MDRSRAERAVSFGAWADEYDDCRPGYPESAVAWLLDSARVVVEVGAGTGKLTDRLVGRHDVSLHVTEIDRRMLRVVRARHPTVPVVEAAATALPVDDDVADAVLVADAWQWFPKEEAADEVARVLRPGGWLGCVWNDLSAATPGWQWDAVGLRADIAERVRRLTPIERLGLARGETEERTFAWTWELTPRQFRGYVATLSHVRTLPAHECQDALDLAERLAVRACDAAGRPTVALELDAVCVRWRPGV